MILVYLCSTFMNVVHGEISNNLQDKLFETCLKILLELAGERGMCVNHIIVMIACDFLINSIAEEPLFLCRTFLSCFTGPMSVQQELQAPIGSHKSISKGCRSADHRCSIRYQPICPVKLKQIISCS